MQGFPTQEEVKRIREQYPVGTRIELDRMDNERDMPSGLKGMVRMVDDAGQIHMNWDNGRGLALVPGEDSFHILPTEEQAKESEIIVLVVEPGKPPYEKRIENDYQVFREMVGKKLQFISLPEHECYLFCNIDGKLEGLPGNRRLDNGEIVCGTFVVSTGDDRSNEISLTAEQLQYYKERFHEAELYSEEEVRVFGYEFDVSRRVKSRPEQFTDYINAYILPFIDYNQLAQSYHTEEKAYAKGILKLLHAAMTEQYGTDTLTSSYRNIEENFVVVPGVIQGKKSNEVAIALLGIDLSSSGEHCSTEVLCHYGVVSDDDVNRNIHIESYMPYNYGYTAKIPSDIHVQESKLPDGIKEILGDFQNHTAELLNFGLDKDNENDMER